jgi:hypothetical protein
MLWWCSAQIAPVPMHFLLLWKVECWCSWCNLHLVCCFKPPFMRPGSWSRTQVSNGSGQSFGLFPIALRFRLYCTDCFGVFLELPLPNYTIVIIGGSAILILPKGWLDVTSHIAWEWRCAYIYKCIIFDITRFKAVMTMNLLELYS